jgi:hypothetical protein
VGILLGKGLAIAALLMLPTMALPRGVTVALAGELCQVALDELDTLDPNESALGRWLWTSYRSALVVGRRDHWPYTLHTTTPIDELVTAAQRDVVRARRAVRTRPGSFASHLPTRVHVTRVRDEDGRQGFAPIDAPSLSLSARALSLLLVDYLMQPERYGDDSPAASTSGSAPGTLSSRSRVRQSSA